MVLPLPFFRQVESVDFWRRIAPWLHVETSPAAGALPSRNDPAPAARWPASGYVRLDRLFDASTVDGLARGISALRGRGIHPVFAYVYDEAWGLLEMLLPRLGELLGSGLEVMSDVWAWHIDPRRDSGGWTLHRGLYEDVRDAAGIPGVLNVWIALTTASERNACMHLVPLPRDPHHPGDLSNLSGLEPLGEAEPAVAGSALVWNANVAHWGGRCDPTFDQPRISMSFTLRRGASHAMGMRPLHPPLTFRERLDVIAENVDVYGDKELDPASPLRRWAVLVSAMRLAAGRTPRKHVE